MSTTHHATPSGRLTCRRAAPLAAAALSLVIAAGSSPAHARPPAQGPAFGSQDWSPGLLGAYRKAMEIEGELRRLSERHSVNFDLVRALCLVDVRLDAAAASGGREGCLAVPPSGRSSAEAPSLEDGVGHLARLLRQVQREDYAVAAYRAGLATVTRRQPMNLDTLHYVTEVGHYRAVLRVHEPSLRSHAERLLLTTVTVGESWDQLSGRLGVPELHLRLFNPAASSERLREGRAIAYPPPAAAHELVRTTTDALEYRARLGDTCGALASALGLGIGVIQQTGVWCVEGLHPGVQIRLPLRPEGEYTPHYVAPGETLSSIAARLQIDTWTLRRSNGLFGPEEVLAPGTLLWVLRTPPPAPAIGAVAARAAATLADPAHPGDPTDQHEAPQVHRVAPGETLAAIARRYSTSVAAIQAANGLGRRTLIRAGDHLKIPGTVAVR